MKMGFVIFVLFGYQLTFISSQHTSINTCLSARNDENTECIISHVSEKIEQLSTQINSICNDGGNRWDESTNGAPFGFADDGALRDMSLPQNCHDLFLQGHTRSGVYAIYEPIQPIHTSQFRSDGRRMINVYCDMEEEYGGPGWIVFQRRQDGSVNFTRLWNDYRDGFGELSGELWLGNDNLALITGGELAYELRVELGDWDNERQYARYDSFKLTGDLFTLRLGAFAAGDSAVGDSLDRSRGFKFSTIDRDNDANSGSCAELYYKTGFWFGSCGDAHLNNPYHYSSAASRWHGVVWQHWRGDYYSLKFVEMKIRPVIG